MSAPSTKGVLRTKISDMNIGDYISCEYIATSGAVGTFGNLGMATKAEIPVGGTATPNGTFFFVKSDKGLLIADRIVQHSISWDSLNARGFIQGTTLRSGIRFNGVNSYVSVPYSATLSPTSRISVMVECSMDDWTTGDAYMNIANTLDTGGYGITRNNQLPNGVCFTVFVNGSYRVAGVLNSSLKSGRHVFIGTFDGRYIKFYVDGILSATTDLNATYAVTYSVNSNFVIGADANGTSTPASNWFNGDVFRAAIWSKALTQVEIDNVILNSDQGAIGYWDFSQVNASNTTVYNLYATGNGAISSTAVVLSGTSQIRSLTGGVAYADENGNFSATKQNFGGWPLNNEWDKYIVNSDLGGKIVAGDDNVWHYSTLCADWVQETPATGTNDDGGVTMSNIYRILRGTTANSRFFSGTSSYQAQSWAGFRPVFEYKEV